VENPAGLSNHLFAIPVSELTIAANDEANQYDITPTGGGALQGYRIDFKAQTGQVTSEDNGTAKGWSCTGTGRVEMNENDMAHTSRILHNSDQYLYFFATGKKVAGDGGVMQNEYLVIGNENGEAEWAVAGDTGTSRTDDHGQTFTVTCAYQLYPMTKWYGVIEQIDAD
jgi:hypothetical protein